MKIEWYTSFFESLDTTKDSEWISELGKKLSDTFTNPRHGDFSKWQNAVNQLSSIQTDYFNFSDSIIQIGNEKELSNKQAGKLLPALQVLRPWRKGPFNFFGNFIDSEWQSNKKWDRLQPNLPDLRNKNILDIGCGNGYYMLRMLGAGASKVIGLDPGLLFLAQFHALTHCIDKPVQSFLLPFGIEEIPPQLRDFDCVFSMGVLYHRRHPLEHIRQLYQLTKTGGSIFLETLITDDAESSELNPVERYAGMRNVWNIPSPPRVHEWLTESGFVDCHLLNTSFTSVQEQRSTKWMPGFSLRQFLDPADPTKTVEGYPAPLRAIFSARKP